MAMISLSYCRLVFARSRCSRAISALLVLGLIVSEAPRWDLHTHALSDHGHLHAGTLVDHEEEPGQPNEEGPGTAVTHIHEAGTPTTDPCCIEALRLSLVVTGGWVAPFDRSQIAYTVGPPPYRPPIV